LHIYSTHPIFLLIFFFFHHTPTPELSTLSLHDALPISDSEHSRGHSAHAGNCQDASAAAKSLSFSHGPHPLLGHRQSLPAAPSSTVAIPPAPGSNRTILSSSGIAWGGLLNSPCKRRVAFPARTKFRHANP